MKWADYATKRNVIISNPSFHKADIRKGVTVRPLKGLPVTPLFIIKNYIFALNTS